VIATNDAGTAEQPLTIIAVETDVELGSPVIDSIGGIPVVDGETITFEAPWQSTVEWPIEASGDVGSFQLALGAPVQIDADTGLITGFLHKLAPSEATVWGVNPERNESSGVTFTIVPFNEPPDVEPVADLQVQVGKPIYTEVIASDRVSSRFDYVLDGAPDGVTIDTNGVIEGLAPLTPSTYTVTVSVDDGNDGVTETSFTIEVIALQQSEFSSPSPADSFLYGDAMWFEWNSLGLPNRLTVGLAEGGTEFGDFEFTGGEDDQLVFGLPADGTTIYATLSTEIASGEWVDVNYQWFSRNVDASKVASIVSPAAVFPLAGSDVTFTWDGGTPQGPYILLLGTEPYAADIQQLIVESGTSADISGLATDGSEIHVTLITQYDEARWHAGSTGASVFQTADPTKLVNELVNPVA